MKTALNSAIVVICFILVSCSNSEKIDATAEEEKIRNVFQTWIKKVSEKESADAYFEFVTDDFIMSEPNSEPVSDRESIKSSIKALFATSTFSVTNWKSQEIIMRDDIAIHRHSGTININSKTDTTRFTQDLKYLDILKRNERGEWKVYIHSYMPSKQD